MRRGLAAGLATLLLVLAACTKDKDVEPPAQLVPFPATLPVKKLWSEKVPGGNKKFAVLRLGLGPAVDDGVVFAASHKGEVVALALETGRELWRKKTKLPLSAGPAAGQGMVVVGSSKGTLVALDAKTGDQRWRTQIRSELLSTPAISDKIVAVRSVDGRLHGLDPATGKESWSAEQQVPKLSLRGTAIPVIAKDAVLSGFDNGKVMAVSVSTGDTIWDTAVAAPHGRTELERLIDIDSAVAVVGDDVFVAGFQGRTAMLALDSGQVWWAHDMSSYRGLAADGDDLYVTQSDGEIVALRQRDGSEIWRNKKLRMRALTVPAVTSSAIAVADLQGYLHWLDKRTGELVARELVAKKQRISNPLAVAGDTVVVLTDAGEIGAYRATPTAATPTPPAAATGSGKPAGATPAKP